MRYLILSDLHANWEALQAVLAQAESGYDQIVCCGDLVGYGADPDLVTEWARENTVSIVRGNHDKACAGLEDLEWFNPIARQSVVWTQNTMKPSNLDYLRNLRKGPEIYDDIELVHGSPVDEDEYIVTEREVAQIVSYLDSNIAFFGHTHLQGAFLCHRNGVKLLGADTIEIENDSIYYINPGSVGQPRDGDPRAAYAIYELESRLVTLRRTPYDVLTTQQKIVKAGLPEILARRLSAGA